VRANETSGYGNSALFGLGRSIGLCCCLRVHTRFPNLEHYVGTGVYHILRIPCRTCDYHLFDSTKKDEAPVLAIFRFATVKAVKGHGSTTQKNQKYKPTDET
jgi:hypothetical protein